MNRRIRNPTERFLKPGALARIRDSKIRVRPGNPIKIRFPPLSSFSHPPASSSDGSPRFSARINGPRFLNRKKLVATKRTFFVPSSPIADPGISDSGLDLLGSDLIVSAH